MRPALTAFWSGVVGLLLAVVFVAIGDFSLEPSDHPAWLVGGSGPVIAAYRILMGFCLPGFFINFALMAMTPQMLGYDAIAGRPGDVLNYLTYPLVQSALFGGVAWLMTSLGRVARKMLSRWGVSPGATTADASSGTRSCPRSRWGLFGVVAAFVILYSGASLFFLVPNVPTWWTADYDKERYTEVYNAIKADRQHLLGKPLDEITREFGLDDVSWDDAAVQSAPGTYRIYHFRGFAFHVTLERLPAGITPNSDRPWTATGEELQRHGVWWLAHQYPFVRIDGISDGKERMRRYWKAVDEECERINARMEQERQRKRR